MVLALDNARTMIDHGFTSLFSAAGVGYNKIRIEPVLRNVINAGRYPGPRIKAASPEIVSSGGLGDERKWHMHQESVGFIADGPDEVRKACRLCVREGVDNLKINISGDEFCQPGQSEKSLISMPRSPQRPKWRAKQVSTSSPMPGRTRRCASRSARHQHHLPRRLRDQ